MRHPYREVIVRDSKASAKRVETFCRVYQAQIVDQVKITPSWLILFKVDASVTDEILIESLKPIQELKPLHRNINDLLVEDEEIAE